MSGLPVASRLKPPASRIAKAPSTKAEGIPTPRSGIKPPSTDPAQKTQTGLRQPLTKRSAASDTEKIEKRSTNSTAASSSILTPRSKQSGSQSKLNQIGHPRPQQTSVTKREGLSSSLKRQSSGSTSSLNKEPERPSLTREKTKESLKDVDTGILFKVGDRVLVGDSKAGVIEYLGETKFAKGYWAGIKLDEPSGKNDGCVAGVRYFDCEPLHGVFSKPNRLRKINIVPEKKSVSDFKLEESNVLKIGDMVIVSGTKPGILRYLGPTEFAKGEWAGVELQEPSGKNDGAVAGTRYFTCEMKYGLFAPASKVMKSKRLALTKKPSVLSPEAALASAAKSIFNKTTALNSEISDIAASSPSERPSASEVNASASPSESLHQTVKKAPSNAQQVATLQSALEEREREIRKMLMERELEKAEKLKALDKTTKSDDNVHEQALKEKDDLIRSLREDLDKARVQSASIQTKLDEEKKKYEDLQFMLEEEKITDDELKNHVKEDENKIKQLSDQTSEKNKKIMELQMELREARADNLKNEAKILELQDELAELKSKTARFESGTEASVITAQHNGQQLETLLANANKLLDESREDVNKKNQQINKLEIKLNSQINRQKEMGNETEREMKQKLTSAEAKNLSLNAQILDLEDQLTQSKTKILELESDFATAAGANQHKVQQLETLLANAKRALDEEKEEVNKKNQLVNEMESKLNAQIERQKEIEKEVESLDQADKNLTLMKEAHRTEIESLQSKLSSLTNTIATMERKQNDLVNSHNDEMELFAMSRGEEIKNLKDKISVAEREKNDTLKECENLKSEKGKVLEELSRLQTDHNTVELSQSATLQNLQELEKKCDDLSEANVLLSSERNDAIQLCEDQDQQLDVLKKEKDSLSFDKEKLSQEKDELSKRMVSLETQIKKLHSESAMKQGELQETKESEIRNLKAQLEEEAKERQTTSDMITNLRNEKESLENDLKAKTNEVNALLHEQHRLHSLSQELEGQVSDLKRKMLEDTERAQNEEETLKKEIAILKDDLEERKRLLKQKDEDIRTYKEQIEKMGSEGIPKSPMDGDILENASTLLIRLHEAESKLTTLQSEKETAEEQVEFLNSVIVDLQNKNQKANQTIALLEAGDETVLLHGLDSESDEEVMGKPKYSMRKFCDICDVFDKHDTDECPMQEGGEDTGGVKNYGDRDHERPYCNICEAFGHWTEDCDDEQTF